MKLTEKEKLLLKDLKTAEQLCIDKYTEYMGKATDKKLKNIFSSIKTKEEEHLKTVQKIMDGKTPTMNSGSKAKSSSSSSIKATQNLSEKDKKHNAYLCQDALSTEKYVSATYNTSVFEFAQPKLRNVLNHIQKEEQEHGLKIYQYMSANNMMG